MGLRGEHAIAELCRREGIAESLYDEWSKESPWRPARSGWGGDTEPQVSSGEVKDLHRAMSGLKEMVANVTETIDLALAASGLD